MGTPFINNKSENTALRSLLKVPESQNRVIGKDPTKGQKPVREVNLPVRGTQPK
jgi:hypothetical protein